MADWAPGFEPSELNSARDAVTKFLYQNGFTNVEGSDAAGFRPLHYAAMSGDALVVKGLLMQRANPNRRTNMDEPKLGVPGPWVAALDLAVYNKHSAVTRVSIFARAKLEGGSTPAIQKAASADNAEGIRPLCEAGSNPFACNLIGPDAWSIAAAFGSVAAIEELLRHCVPSTHVVSHALDSGQGRLASDG